jgi:hypothetical protein
MMVANMGYCRFENTAKDLLDCLGYLDDEPKSVSEKKARRKIIEMAVEIARDYGDEIGEEV